MNRLSYQTLKEQHYPGYLLEHAPERVLQFGEEIFSGLLWIILSTY